MHTHNIKLRLSIVTFCYLRGMHSTFEVIGLRYISWYYGKVGIWKYFIFKIFLATWNNNRSAAEVMGCNGKYKISTGFKRSSRPDTN